jgi:hypothetical protein
MVCNDEDHGTSRRLGAEDRGWSHRSSTRWSGNWKVGRGGAVCGLHHARGDEKHEFLGWASKTLGWFVCGLASKQLGQFVSGLATKLVATISPGLASKPVARVKSLGRFSLVWPQNWWRRILPVWPQNLWLGFSGLGLKTSGYDLVIWATESLWWFLDLDLKTRHASVCRLRHKTDGGRMPWDTRQDLATCFAWKQVTLGFPSPASRLVEARRWVVHVA